MNKSKALQWLVENVTKWPTSRGGIKTSPDGWSWGVKSPGGDITLFTDTPSGDYVGCFIEQQEWSDGADNEPMSRNQAFDKLFELYSDSTEQWPTLETDLTTVPTIGYGWSWQIIRRKCQDPVIGLYRGVYNDNIFHDVYNYIIVKHIFDKLVEIDDTPAPISQDKAFEWLYSKFSKCMDTWPGEWSWYIPNNRGKCLPGTRAILAGPPTVDCEHITFENVMKYVEGEQRDTTQAKIYESMVEHAPVILTPPISTIVYYIAGPMSGLPNFNRDNFNRIASELDGAILNPATLPDGLSQRDYMSICLPMVQASTHMFMLHGWENSPGANAEHSLAIKLNLEIEYE